MNERLNRANVQFRSGTLQVEPPGFAGVRKRATDSVVKVTLGQVFVAHKRRWDIADVKVQVLVHQIEQGFA